MIGVAQARTIAREKLTRHLVTWACAAGAVDGFPLSIPLKPPTEREALADVPAAQAWAREWLGFPASPGLETDWATRSWTRLGAQRIPVRVRLADAIAVAQFVGGETERELRTLSARAAGIRARVGVRGGVAALDAATRANGRALLRLRERDYAMLLDVVAWLVANPATGLRPRQLPIRGIDTKWFGAHRGLVTALHGACTDGAPLGIIEADARIRLRVIDDRLLPAGPRDFAAPVADVAALRFASAPRVVLVVENLETVLSMPSMKGAVVVHGSGYAVDALRHVPWIRSGRVLYWGDLDSHGFSILHRLRSGHPNVESVLMDERTLLEHRDLWVTEDKPARGANPTLNEAERRALARVRLEGDARLEQERIPWSYAIARVGAAAARIAASEASPNEPWASD